MQWLYWPSSFQQQEVGDRPHSDVGLVVFVIDIAALNSNPSASLQAVLLYLAHTMVACVCVFVCLFACLFFSRSLQVVVCAISRWVCFAYAVPLRHLFLGVRLHLHKSAA